MRRYNIGKKKSSRQFCHDGKHTDAVEAVARIAELEKDIWQGQSLLEEAESQLADAQSRLAGVKEAVDRQPKLSSVKDPHEQANIRLAYELDAILSPDFTCPGCREKDGRLEKAREAWEDADISVTNLWGKQLTTALAGTETKEKENAENPSDPTVADDTSTSK